MSARPHGWAWSSQAYVSGLWKYLLLVVALFLSFLYALPNLYGKDPAVLIAPLRTSELNKAERNRIETALKQAGIKVKDVDELVDKLKNEAGVLP